MSRVRRPSESETAECRDWLDEVRGSTGVSLLERISPYPPPCRVMPGPSPELLPRAVTCQACVNKDAVCGLKGPVVEVASLLAEMGVKAQRGPAGITEGLPDETYGC